MVLAYPNFVEENAMPPVAAFSSAGVFGEFFQGMTSGRTTRSARRAAPTSRLSVQFSARNPDDTIHCKNVAIGIVTSLSFTTIVHGSASIPGITGGRLASFLFQWWRAENNVRSAPLLRALEVTHCNLFF